MPFRTKKTRIYQYDIIVKGSRFRGSCGTDDWEEAKQVEAQIRADAKHHRLVGGAYTLSEALGTYFRDKATGTPSEATTRSQAKAILKHMDGRTQLQQLTDAEIQLYVSKDRASCKNATVNRRLQMLGRALKHMAKVYKADIPHLDLRGAETKEPRERVRELSFEEQRNLFDALPHEFHSFVLFALMTGARIATISGLLWSDVDMENREITFRLKGDDLMFFPINDELAALLSAQPKSNIVQHRRFVFTRVDGHSAERIPIGSNGGVFGTVWRGSLASAGIVNFRFHDLRHTFCTRMLRNTNNLKLVSRLAGHKNIDTTMRYAHVMIDDLRQALDGYSVAPSIQKRYKKQ